MTNRDTNKALAIIKNMTQYKTFKSFLEDKFWEYNPMTLDDDGPDKFNDWLEMDNDLMFKLVDEYVEGIKVDHEEEIRKLTFVK